MAEHAAGAAKRRRQRRLRQWQRHERMTVAMALAAATHHAAPWRQKPVSAIREVEDQVHFSGDGLPQLAMPSLAGRCSPRFPPLSVAGGEGARGPEEERGGGEGGPQGVEGAPQEGQG